MKSLTSSVPSVNKCNAIVNALHSASSIKVPSCSSVFKAYWSEELNEFKHKSIFWHDIWLSAGRPTSGVLFSIKTKCKYQYKNAIRSAYINYESQYTDEFVSHFLNKDSP